MQTKRTLKVLMTFSSLVIIILAISIIVSSCQLTKEDEAVKNITFENIFFMDGDRELIPEGKPKPEDFIPEKEGHIFRYWAYMSGNVQKTFKSENYDGSPITLYAVWKANEYVVKFFDSDGSVLTVGGKDEQRVKYGQSALLPAIPEKRGYKFAGWDASYENVTQDLDIKAKYEKIAYSVEFFFGKESLVQKSGYIDEKITNFEKEAKNVLSAYTSQGLSFDGWYYDSSFKEKAVVSEISISENITLYAKMSPSKLKSFALTTDKANNTFVYNENLEITVNCAYQSHGIITYETAWYLDGKLLQGETKNRLLLKNVELGEHDVKAEITSTYGDFSKIESIILTISVVKKQLQIKANDITINYGDETPVFSYTVDTEESVDLGTAIFNCSYKSGDHKGVYSISVSGLSSSIYELSFTTGVLTVLPKNIAVKVQDCVVSYGDALPEFGFSADILDGDSLIGGEYSCEYRKGMSVGNYDINLKGLENPNYTVVEYKSGVLTVEKRVVKIKIESKSKVYYGDPQPEFEYSILKGDLLEGDSLGTPKYICDYSEGSKADRYIVTLVGLNNPNYDIQTNTLLLRVYPKEISANWTVESEYVYTGNDQSKTVKADYTDIHGRVIELIPKFEIDNTEYAFVDAGTYNVSVQSNDENYKIVNDVRTISINKRLITIEVHDKTVTYGDDVPEYTYTALGVIGEENLGKVEFECQYTKGSGVGVYRLKAVGFENPNYDINYNNAMLTVVKRPVKVEWSIGFSYVYSGKVQSDTIHALFRKYDGKNTVMTLTYYLANKVASFKNAGEYRVVASTDDENYIFEDSERRIVIDPKPIMLSIDDKSVTYGDNPPVYTFRTEGLVGGESDSILGKPHFICEYACGKDAGEFEIGCEPFANGNYSITYENATLTVNKMSVEAIWDYRDGYTYNGYSQAETISVKFRGYQGNYITLSVSFACGEYEDFYHAGIYTVTAWGDSEKNYEINHKQRTFEITQKDATLKVIDKTISYGDKIPVFKYEASGLVGNDDLGTLNYDCVYNQGAPSSSYEVSIVPFLCVDYKLSYENAILIVENRLVSVGWESSERYVYNKTNQRESVTAKFLGYSGEYEIAELTFSLNGKESEFISSGKYAVTATFRDKNYTLQNDKIVLEMEKKEIEVAPISTTISYGDAIPVYSYKAVGLESGDLLYGESFSCSYERGKSIGTYDLTVDFAEQDNYIVNAFATVLIVEPLNVSVEWCIPDITYNGLIQKDSVQAYFPTYDGNMQKVDFIFIQNGETVSFKNAGEYTAVVDYENENYRLNNAEIDTTILPKTVNVLLENKNIMFGNTVEFTHTVSGLAENESESVLGEIVYKCDYAVGSPVGNYVISANGLYNSNYSINYKSSLLTIDKRAVEAEWTVLANYVYNGREQTEGIGVTYTSYNGESVPMEIIITSGNSIFKNAGDYLFTAMNNDANYAVSNLTRKITIDKARYTGISHGVLVGTYDPEITLEKYILEHGFRWANAEVLPTVKQTRYKALYNADIENYYDFELYIQLTLSKADYNNITHSVLTGTYDENKTLSSYTLEEGFVWEDERVVPTVNRNKYNALFNKDRDNYNDYFLDVELQLEKGTYINITHKTLEGRYSPTQRLKDFSLEVNFVWQSEDIVPTVGVTKYTAVYNRDSVNYNDYILDISLLLTKATYSENEVPAHRELNGTYDSQGKLSDYSLDTGFCWENPSLKPTVKIKNYQAYYNLDSENFENYAVTIAVNLIKAEFVGITHKALSGTYDSQKTLSNYILDEGFSWVDGSVLPTVPVKLYNAIYNSDSDNYNDCYLQITLNLRKADYGEITHTPLTGVFDENKTLNDYLLSENFRWADGSIVPSSEKEEYKALYNADSANYNDKVVMIKVTVAKTDYSGQIPNDFELNETYDPDKTLDDYALPFGFRWVDPTFYPTLGRVEYEVYYNPNPYGYNDVLTTVVLTTSKK